MFITGASSGIGKSTAELLLKKDFIVYGTSRKWSEELVEKEKNFFQLKLDVEIEASVKKCVRTILDREKKIDVLVNNAGFGYVSPLMFGAIDDAKKQFETNFFGAIRVMEQVIPNMIERRDGKIITIGSIAGRIAIPYQGLYCASKSAIAAYSDALRMECKKFNIGVTLIEPGVTKTDFGPRRIVIDGKATPDFVKNEMYKAQNISETEEPTGLDSGKVANVIYKAVKSKHPKIRYTTGFDSKMVNYGTRIFPKGIMERLISNQYKISNKKTS